jgi:hypothetical protein
MKTKRIVLSLAMLIFFFISMSTKAHESSPVEGWQFTGAFYMWGTSIGGETSEGDDIDIGFDDVWDNLNISLTGHGVARNGNWLVFTDIQYADLEGGDNTTANIVGQPVKAKLDVRMKQWIVQAGGGYTVSKSDKHILDVIAGARYFYQDTELKFKIGPLTGKVDDSKDNLDAIIGINNHLNLNDKWYLNSYVDIGTGESEFTWQAMALLGYEFKTFNAVFGYRHLYWDFDGDKGLGKDYNEFDLSGPVVGVVFTF